MNRTYKFKEEAYSSGVKYEVGRLFKEQSKTNKDSNDREGIRELAKFTSVLGETGSNRELSFIAKHLTIFLEGFSNYVILPHHKTLDWTRYLINPRHNSGCYYRLWQRAEAPSVFL